MYYLAELDAKGMTAGLLCSMPNLVIYDGNCAIVFNIIPMAVVVSDNKPHNFLFPLGILLQIANFFQRIFNTFFQK